MLTLLRRKDISLRQIKTSISRKAKKAIKIHRLL